MHNSVHIWRGQPLSDWSLHCNLARFRGLMTRGKYGAVIGHKESIAWKFVLSAYKKSCVSTNHSAVFPPDHQTTESRQTTAYKLQWLLTPPNIMRYNAQCDQFDFLPCTLWPNHTFVGPYCTKSRILRTIRTYFVTMIHRTALSSFCTYA